MSMSTIKSATARKNQFQGPRAEKYKKTSCTMVRPVTHVSCSALAIQRYSTEIDKKALRQFRRFLSSP